MMLCGNGPQGPTSRRLQSAPTAAAFAALVLLACLGRTDAQQGVTGVTYAATCVLALRPTCGPILVVFPPLSSVERKSD